jgi:hemoglobin
MDMKIAQRRVWSLIVAVAIGLIVVGSFSQEAQARRHRRHRKSHKAIINEPKLFERIGGSKVVSAIVDEWLRIDFADQRLGPIFADVMAKPDQLAKLRKAFAEQICEMTDGPCVEKGADPKPAVEAMKGNEDRFLAYAENLFKAMQKMNISEREKNETLGRLGEARNELMSDSEDESDPAVVQTPAKST